MDGNFLNKILGGGQKPVVSQAPAADDADFADFAGAPDPSPASILPAAASGVGAGASFATPTGAAVPYTAWYRIWERTTPGDFIQETFILPFLILAVVLHLWGSRINRKIAKGWVTAHAPILKQEYAVVGWGGRRTPNIDEVESEGLLKASASEELDIPEELLKENSGQEFVTYATGRANTAFTDFTLTLLKRYNPLVLGIEYAISFFLESFAAPVERLEVVTYAFDGKESELVPSGGGKLGQEVTEQRKATSASSYDGFVWAVVHKDVMKQLREERYDVSITSTKDNPKLPSWATVMTESAEVTELLLTPQLISAIESAGEKLEYLIVTDQPLNQPQKLDDTVPKKRLYLSVKLPEADPEFSSTLPLFQYFLRLPDLLAHSAHLRPEVVRKVRQTRDDQIRKIQRVDETEKAEERAIKLEKEKKEKRDAKLKNLSAEEQRKFLEKERKQDAKRSQKKMSVKA